MMKTIEELEKYAKENYIPIARKDMVSFLIKLIKDNNYHSVLEIGAAIGYTTLQLAELPDVHVTTFEYWPPRYEVCVQNIKDFNLEDKITLSKEDALLTDIKDKYDLIFIDGAKKKTIKLYEHLKNNINDDGTIIIDNIDLKVVEQIELKNKRIKYQQIAKETKEYFESITDYIVTYLNIGDGIYMIKKK